jgi:hypothetical protein
LFNVVVDPPDPFDSTDPMHWFSGTVSYLSCWLELADHAFDPLTRYEYRPTASDLEAVSPPAFFYLLGRLRTSMQHGLNPGSTTDQATLKAVQSWYYGVCGVLEPTQQHWRRLTASLLDEAAVAAERLAIVTDRLPSCPSRAAVESQIRFYSRSLSKEEWRVNLRVSVQDLAPDLDPNLLLEKHLSELQKKLREMPIEPAEISARARELADSIVCREAAKCPVGPRDLLELGVQPGPLIATTFAKVEAEWQRDPTQSRIVLLEFARVLVDNTK